MQTYLNLGGKSGIDAYDFGPEGITIRFSTGALYRYDEKKPGTEQLERMKALATAGRGLNGYINRYVRDNYAQRLS